MIQHIRRSLACLLPLIVLGCSPVTLDKPFGEPVPTTRSGLAGWWTAPVEADADADDGVFLRVTEGADGGYEATFLGEVDDGQSGAVELRQVGRHWFVFLSVENAGEPVTAWSVLWLVNTPADDEEGEPPDVLVLAPARADVWATAIEDGKLDGSANRPEKAANEDRDSPADPMFGIAEALASVPRVQVTASEKQLADWLEKVSVGEAFDTSEVGVLYRLGTVQLPTKLPSD
ncbi:MAG: hypothetical protein AAGD32_03280 [Planctomycetota bacterium]